MWVPKFVKVAMIKAFLKSNDNRTTLLGLIAGGLIAANIDWGKVFAADPMEIGKVAGAIVAVLIGYLTNKPDANSTGAGK